MSKEKIDLDKYTSEILSDDSLSLHDKLISLKNIMLEIFIYWFANNQHFKDKNIVFYGGTALNRCVFSNFRFSEDLDFWFEMLNVSVSEIKEYILEIRSTIEKTFDFKDAGLWQFFITVNNFSPGSIKLSFNDNHLTNIINTMVLDDKNNRKDFWKIAIDIQAYWWKILAPKNMEIKKIKYELLGFDNEILCKSTEDIITWKMKAFVDRKKDRDFYDILKIFEFLPPINFRKYIKIAWIDEEIFKKTLTEFNINKDELYPILRDKEFNDIDNYIEKSLPNLLENFSTKNISLKSF